jgi:uncharacterized membrane protein YqiK
VNLSLIYALGAVGGFLVAVFLIFVSGTVRYIGNNRTAVVEKLWSRRGSIKSGLIALNGEAGFQPEVLRGGVHVFLPFQFRLHLQTLVTIPQGRIGYVFARDGAPLAPDQTLAANPDDTNFQDTRRFLLAGGQKGPQRKILREGAYALNLAQFVVVTKDQTFALILDKSDAALLDQMADIIEERDGFLPMVIKNADDMIGIVTVHDGPSLPAGEIIAPTVGQDPSVPATYHNSFQDPERFRAAGVSRAGSYRSSSKAPTTSTGCSRRSN